jgi:hypothetical protein
VRVLSKQGKGEEATSKEGIESTTGREKVTLSDSKIEPPNSGECFALLLTSTVATFSITEFPR